LPHSSSASRFTAGASEFFILSQSWERPEDGTLALRDNASRPSLQAWAWLTRWSKDLFLAIHGAGFDPGAFGSRVQELAARGWRMSAARRDALRV